MVSIYSNTFKLRPKKKKKKVLWKVAKASLAGKGQKGEWASQGGWKKEFLPPVAASFSRSIISFPL